MPQSRARRTVAQGLMEMTLFVRLICFVDTLGVGGQNYYRREGYQKNNVWMADCSLDSCAQ